MTGGRFAGGVLFATEPLYAARGGGDRAAGARISAQGSMQWRLAERVEVANPITFLLPAEASVVTAGLDVADGGEASC